MKKYYTHNGTNQQGPFTLEDLLKSGIAAETQIWHDGLESWSAAKNLDELKMVFAQKTPPPLPPPVLPPASAGPPLPVYHAAPVKKSSGWIWRMLLVILVVAAAVIIFRIKQRSNSGYRGSNGYLENKMSTEDYERANPAQFLDASGTYRETLLGNKMRINGTVINRASVAKYKDIVIEVSYFSATQTLIDKERFTLFEYIPAHSTKSFDWKIKPPGGTSTMGWRAVGGVGY